MRHALLLSSLLGIAAPGLAQEKPAPAASREADTMPAPAASREADAVPAGGAAALGEPLPAVPPVGSDATAQAQARVIAESRTGLSTKLRILVYTADETGAREAVDAAFAEMARVEALLSEWRPDSETSRLNQAAGNQAVELSSETMSVLEAGLRISRMSHGAFALTWAALASLWDFSPGAAHQVPAPKRIEERVRLVDDGKLQLDAAASTAKLLAPGMAVGLGGIAKGYAIDRALAVLAERGFGDALVFAGGDIAVNGRKGDRPWLVGIQDPRAAGYFAVLPLNGGAIATSGDYEHYFELDGKRYHHILDPHTGMPARGARSVSVIAADATTADALATAVFVLGPEEGMRLVESQAGVEAVIVDASNQVAISSGLRKQLRVLRSPTE